MTFMRFLLIAVIVNGSIFFVGAGRETVFAADSTYYVDDDYGNSYPGSGTLTDPYHEIQMGIDAASADDTVQVAAGTYVENINMKFGVVIQGAGAGDDPSIHSIIDGGGTGPVVSASGVDPGAKLDGFKITNGYAPMSGGGMFIQSNPTVINCIYSGNTSGNRGGGMYNLGGNPTVTSCIFSGNSAEEGGGMYNINSSPTVTNCTFSQNSADIDGGGMYNLGSNSSPTVTSCTFSGNSAEEGGGMYNSNSSPTVTNCTFSGNLAHTGGGMHNYDSPQNLAVTNCIFSGNTAFFGGGISNDTSSPTVTNCILTGNTGYVWGGGMYNTSASPTVTNCTFSQNSADIDGGGMYNDSSSPIVTNCILWGDSPPEIKNDQSSSPVVTYSNIQGGHVGTGNIIADPMFLDPDGPDNVLGTEDDDLHLKSGSPCIDTGTATGAPDTDIEGKPRPLGKGFDMGAYEFQGTAMPCIPLLLLGD